MSTSAPTTICPLCAHAQRAGARTEHAPNGLKCLARQTSAAIVAGTLVRRYTAEVFDAVTVTEFSAEDQVRTKHAIDKAMEDMERALDCGVLRYVAAAENPPSRARRWAVVPGWFDVLESLARFAGPGVLAALPLILTDEVRAAMIAMSDLGVPARTLRLFAEQVVRTSRFAQPGIKDEDVEAWHQ